MRKFLFCLPFLVPAVSAPAGEMEQVTPVTNESAKKECGACHMAYPPALLPANSWQAIFNDLASHFGDDASLSDSALAELSDYYVTHAAKEREAAPMRITETAWWLDEHEDIKASRWSAPEVKFKGNCLACHKEADQGAFEDD